MNIEKGLRSKYYLVPFIIQFGVLGICMFMHRFFIKLGPSLGNSEMVGMEMSDPTLGRLIYAVAVFIAFVIFTLCASRKAEKNLNFIPFILGMFAGTFLWQSLGEDLWHFKVGGIHFVSMESIAVLPLVLLFLLCMLYFFKKGARDWGVWCAVLSFAVNWLGHYVLIGIYPLFSGLIEINAWCRGTGIILGSLLAAVSLFCGLNKAKTPKACMLSSILSYYAVAVLVFGIKGV